MIMTALAVLNLLANPWGETLSWILQPLVLAGNLLILWNRLRRAASPLGARPAVDQAHRGDVSWSR